MNKSSRELKRHRDKIRRLPHPERPQKKPTHRQIQNQKTERRLQECDEKLATLCGTLK